MFVSIIAALLSLTNTQSAADLEAACEEYQAAYGGEADCSCLAEAVSGDEDLIAMFMEITSPDELANAPDEVKEAVADCS